VVPPADYSKDTLKKSSLFHSHQITDKLSQQEQTKIKLWNTLADNKFTSETNNHTDWVSCVRYSPLLKTPSKVVF